MAQFDVPGGGGGGGGGGGAVGVWIPGEGEWKAAAGLSDIEQGEPVDIDMSWPLRSITKTFTVTLLLQLVDEGEVAPSTTRGSGEKPASRDRCCRAAHRRSA
ncbi:serine hydrolase [Microbacterium aquimaris]|uniref:serine hydrolase n=1 Tax=Microbacterium aquimaris TaxID=459816 RepID=UPI00390646EA